MDSGRGMASNIPCLVCNRLVFDTDNKQGLSLSSSYLEDKKIIVFLLRNVLEISNPFANIRQEDESKVQDNGQSSYSINSCSRYLVTCAQCKESVKQASVIYTQIQELARNFRDIQREIVEALKKGGTTDVLSDEVKCVRNLVKDCDYNGFGLPFIVRGDEQVVDKEEQISSPSEHCEVVVKQEVNYETDKQQVLLIFPEEEKDGDDQVSEMDEEEEDQSDYQVSEQDSDDGSEVEDDYQVSPVNSEGQPEEDDDHHSELDSVAANPTPPLNLLSSFICKKCLQRFPTKEELDQHDNTAHLKEERGPFPCPLEGCPRIFTISAKFPQHFRLLHRKPPFICKNCKQEFSTPNQVQSHHKQSHPLDSFLQQHQPQPPKKPENTKAPKISKRSCPKKPSKIKSRPIQKPKQPSKVTDQHRTRGRPRKPPPKEQPKKPPEQFPCPLCHRSFKKFGSLTTHLKNLHPDNSIPLNELRLKFLPSITSQRSLPEGRHSTKPYKHLGISSFELEYPHIICQRNSQGKFPCPWTQPSPCPRIYGGKDVLQRHIKVQHLNLPLYTCTWSGDGGGEGGSGQVCGKTFATRHNYYAHYDEHRGTPKWKCEDCGMTFYRMNPFTRHKEKMHSGGKFICEICGKGLSCQEYLNSHRSLKHREICPPKKVNRQKVKKTSAIESIEGAGGPGIICEVCGQVLKNKTSLKTHVEAKHEKVPGKHCCHLCGNRYRGSTHLNMHLWQIHQFKAEGYQPKEKVKVAREDKFQCGVKGCKQLFLRKENLEKHGIEVHGEDGRKKGPWNCKFCGKNFFQRIKWEHCVRTHENKESRPEKCEICGKGFPTWHHLRFHLKYTHKLELESKRGQRMQKSEMKI